jgi:hypothetical protein
MLKRFQVDSKNWRSLSRCKHFPEWLGMSHKLVLGACWSRIFWGNVQQFWNIVEKWTTNGACKSGKETSRKSNARKRRFKARNGWIEDQPRIRGCKVEKPNPLRVRVLGPYCKGFYPFW